MGRLLGPGVFGALGSLLGLVTVVTLVAGALQAAITHAVASEEHRREGSRTEWPYVDPLLAWYRIISSLCNYCGTAPC